MINQITQLASLFLKHLTLAKLVEVIPNFDHFFSREFVLTEAATKPVSLREWMTWFLFAWQRQPTWKDVFLVKSASRYKNRKNIERQGNNFLVAKKKWEKWKNEWNLKLSNHFTVTTVSTPSKTPSAGSALHLVVANHELPQPTSLSARVDPQTPYIGDGGHPTILVAKPQKFVFF